MSTVSLQCELSQWQSKYTYSPAKSTPLRFIFFMIESVCVCVRERERERERERACVCVRACVRVCVREQTISLFVLKMVKKRKIYPCHYL